MTRLERLRNSDIRRKIGVTEGVNGRIRKKRQWTTEKIEEETASRKLREGDWQPPAETPA